MLHNYGNIILKLPSELKQIVDFDYAQNDLKVMNFGVESKLVFVVASSLLSPFVDHKAGVYIFRYGSDVYPALMGLCMPISVCVPLSLPALCLSSDLALCCGMPQNLQPSRIHQIE